MDSRSVEPRSPSRQDVAMKGVRLQPRELEPGSSFTSRDLGIEAMDDRLLHHYIHTDADGAGPAPGEPCVAGVILGQSRRPLSSRCRCLSAPA